MTQRFAVSLPAALAALCLSAATASASEVLVVRDGRVTVEQDPYLPPAAATELAPPPGAAASAAATPGARAARTTVSGALKKALKAGQIKQADHDSYLEIYKDGRRARKKAGARCRVQLRSVLVTLERLAKDGQLTASRMPVLFLQLMHNTNFWTMSPKPLIDAGDRVTFDKSPVVFQHYKRQGLQIQPLGNFGKANGLWKACQEAELDPTVSCRRKALRRLLSRMTSLASKRGGFTTWEYFFSFGGGRPPWASGMAQATGIQALARGAEMFANKRYARTASSALGIFEKGPPVGVKVRSGRGAHYALYSFSPGLRVLNAFVQTLVGLRDFSTITGSDKAKLLFKRGDRALRKELPKYDDGDWSLYSIKGAEASYSYHDLATAFLENLCERTGTKTYCRYAKRFRKYQGEREKPGPGEPSPRSCGVT